MRRFYLFCNAGMSTSLLAKKMQKVADKNNLPIEVKAFPDSKLDQIVNEFHPDCILLGPQAKYLYNQVVEIYGSLGQAIFVIDTNDYANMNAEKILKIALDKIKDNKCI